MADYHIGERATAKTDHFDQMSGVRYTCSVPDAVNIVDSDAELRDVEVEFVALTADNETAILQVELYGDPGDGLSTIVLQSPQFRVVPGAAVSGLLTLELKQVAPPPLT